MTVFRLSVSTADVKSSVPWILVHFKHINTMYESSNVMLELFILCAKTCSEYPYT